MGFIPNMPQPEETDIVFMPFLDDGTLGKIKRAFKEQDGRWFRVAYRRVKCFLKGHTMKARVMKTVENGLGGRYARVIFACANCGLPFAATEMRNYNRRPDEADFVDTLQFVEETIRQFGGEL
jgi:hypothetical protein